MIEILLSEIFTKTYIDHHVYFNFLFTFLLGLYIVRIVFDFYFV